MIQHRSTAGVLFAAAVAALSVSNTPVYAQVRTPRVARAATVITRLDGLTLSKARVTETVQRLMRKHRIPGLSVAILNRAEIVYLRSFGERNVESHLPLNDSTVMNAASLTEAMFSFMVMQLVDDKVIDLDKPIHTYLDASLTSHAKYQTLVRDERYKRITGRMLLNHTSGLPNFGSVADSTLDIKFDPGTKYSYSSDGIDLLGFVVEHVTKRPLAELMNERVFQRYNMKRTSMVWRPAFESNFAMAYDDQGKPVTFDKYSIAHAAISASTTIRDMAIFFQTVVGGRGLTVKTRTEMLKPHIPIRSARQFPTSSTETIMRNDKIRLSYAMGWGVFMTPYGPAFFKDGHDSGWSHYMVAFDDPKTAIILMSNSVNGQRAFQDLVAALIGDTFTPSGWLDTLSVYHGTR